MFTAASKNPEAAVGRILIARQRVQGCAGRKIFIADENGNSIAEVPFSAVPYRSIRDWSWLSRFSSNFGSQSHYIVAWSMVAVAIVVLSVTTGLMLYQTASSLTKSAIVSVRFSVQAMAADISSLLETYKASIVDVSRPGATTTQVARDPQQPPPQQQVVQQAVNQPTALDVTTSLVNAQLATKPPAPKQLPTQQPSPPSGQMHGFGEPSPFVANKSFIVPRLSETRFMPNEVVLQVGSNISRERLEAVMARLGMTILDMQSLASLGSNSIRIGTKNVSVAEAIRQLARQQVVAAASANYVYALTQDPAARSSENVEGDAGQYVLGKLRLADVHRELRGTNVLIAVIDTEIDGNHPDLEGVIAGHFDAIGSEQQPHAHGTGMAGAIASHRKLLGIAPGARLLAIRAFSNKMATAESTTFNILKSLDYAINNGARIVNMSFAGPRDPTLERAFKVAHDKGVVLIAAAGNAGPKSPPLFPAADQNVIAVTATNIDDKLFSSANRGRHIAISAPGVDILVPAPEGTYQMTTGTSVATAHISGIVALLLEHNPNLTPDDIRKILTASAKRLGPKNEFGAGLVDPAKALKLAEPKTAGAAAADMVGNKRGSLFGATRGLE